MSPNTHYIQAFELEAPCSNSLNPSPISNSTTGQESQNLPDFSSMNHALKSLEKNLDNSPAMFMKFRPQLEKIGAVSTQQASAINVKIEIQKLLKYMRQLNKKLFDTEKAFAEWINTFESEEVSDFASEVEKFLKVHHKFNRSVAEQLELASTALSTISGTETLRNTELNKYMKCKKERDEFKRKNMDAITLGKYDDKVAHSYATVASSQYICENNIKKCLKPALFGYCLAIKRGDESINELVSSTALDLESYEKQLTTKNPVFDYHQNLSEININATKSDNFNNLYGTMYIQRPNHDLASHSNFNNLNLKPEKKNKNFEINGQNNISGVSDELSEYESEEEDLRRNIFFNSPYDYEVAHESKIPHYQSPFYKKTLHKHEIKKNNSEFHGNETQPLAQREIPNDSQNFDSTENYATFVNGKMQPPDQRANFVGSIINDSSSEMWNS